MQTSWTVHLLPFLMMVRAVQRMNAMQDSTCFSRLLGKDTREKRRIWRTLRLTMFLLSARRRCEEKGVAVLNWSDIVLSSDILGSGSQGEVSFVTLLIVSANYVCPCRLSISQVCRGTWRHHRCVVKKFTSKVRTSLEEAVREALQMHHLRFGGEKYMKIVLNC